DTGISTFFISTRSTLTPHGSVTASILSPMVVDTLSCSLSTSSSVYWPMPVRSVVNATWITASSTDLTSSMARRGSKIRYPHHGVDLHRLAGGGKDPDGVLAGPALGSDESMFTKPLVPLHRGFDGLRSSIAAPKFRVSLLRLERMQPR